MKQRDGSTFNNESGRYETRAPAVLAAVYKKKNNPPRTRSPEIVPRQSTDSSFKSSSFIYFFFLYHHPSPSLSSSSSLLYSKLVPVPVPVPVQSFPASCFFVDLTLFYFHFILFYPFTCYTFLSQPLSRSFLPSSRFPRAYVFVLHRIPSVVLRGSTPRQIGQVPPSYSTTFFRLRIANHVLYFFLRAIHSLLYLFFFFYFFCLFSLFSFLIFPSYTLSSR